MKTPTRILVGGPEVTSAFVLMGLALARRAMMGVGGRIDPPPSLRANGSARSAADDGPRSNRSIRCEVSIAMTVA